MLNQVILKIRINREYLKNKSTASPQVKYYDLIKEIDCKKYYKPMVELIYKILEERRKCSIEN